MKPQTANINQSIYPITPLSISLPLNIFGIGFEENQNHIIRKEGFHVHQFFLCTAGKGRLLFKDKEYQIKPGDFYFVPAHIPHEYYSLEEPWKVRWIAFYADDNLLVNSGCKEFFILSPQQISSYETYYRRIATVLKNETDSGKFQASVILYQMISELYSTFHHQQEKSASEKLVMDNAINFINTNFSNYFTIDELSENCKVSPQYLCRLFQKHLQMRPFQYLALKRIQRAKELLQKSSIPVSKIAKMVGYDDFSYFCLVFKKIEGISPTQFRGMW